MIEKTLTIRLKGQIVKVRGKVFLHCDLIEALHKRLIEKGFVVDIDVLFNNVIAKG